MADHHQALPGAAPLAGTNQGARYLKYRDISPSLNGLLLAPAFVPYGVDGTPVDTSIVSTLSNTAYSASNVTLLAANSSRKGAAFFNDATVALYLKLGAAATTSSFTVKLLAGAYYELPVPYRGIIDGIWDAGGSGAVRATEFS